MQFELNKIHNVDCLCGLGAMESESIDLCITSPPYNLGNNHHTDKKRHNPYNDDMPEEEYQAWQIRVLQEIYRVLKSGGWLFYNHKNRIKDGKMISPLEWILKTEFVRRQEVIWNNGTPNMDKIRFFPFTERIYCLAKGEAVMFNKLALTDDWHISPVGTNTEHTRAFPDKLVTNIMGSVDFEIVLDPFMGSGTVGRIADRYGKKWVGFELQEKYTRLSEKTLGAQRAQGVMAFDQRI